MPGDDHLVMRKNLGRASLPDAAVALAGLAVFIALGGSAYAAAAITGRDVKDRSLTGADLRRARYC